MPNRYRMLGDGMARCLCALLGCLLLAAWTARATAEEGVAQIIGESRAAAARCAEVRKRISQMATVGEQKWAEVLDELQGIIDTVGNDLVPLGSRHSIQARRLCQAQLASLPPAALALYRKRVDAPAGRQLEEALAGRDVLLLRKIVDESFCSRPAEKALDLLGDMAFERGHFGEALEWWRQLAPLPGGKGPGEGILVYPGPLPTCDPARVQAKQLLARLFAGPDADWRNDLAAFRGRYPEASGALAGRTGKYADLVEAVAAERSKEPAEERDWATFGGDARRGLVVPAAGDVLDRLAALCREGPTWRFSLEERARQDSPPSVPVRSVPDSVRARSLAFHPVIVPGQVIVADARFVTAFDIRTGQSSEWYDVAKLNGGVNPNLGLPAPPDLRYTLTVADDKVYARLGVQGLRPEPAAEGARPGRRTESESFLACLSLAPDRAGNHFRWRVRGVGREGAVFEGAPLVADGRLYVASTRFTGERGITSIDCYSADDPVEPPLRWRRDVCASRDVRADSPRYRHHLLTRAGSQLVYCSHAGAIVAVDALTGRTTWGVRYPRKESEGPDEKPPLDDLAPPLFAGGRLYVAPADADLLLCLDPVSGQTLWQREMRADSSVVHLLGVGEGRLIFTARGGLRAVGAADGSDGAGWFVPDAGGSLQPMGRGLLIGDIVLWPTARARGAGLPPAFVVYPVRQSDGRPAGDPTLLHRLPAGNLAYAHGCLTVADQQTLYVFVPPALRLQEKRQQTRREPTSAAAALALARAEADAGNVTGALESFDRAEKLAGAQAGSRRARDSSEQARAERQRLLLRAAARAGGERRWDEVQALFDRAVKESVPVAARLRARMEAARVWQEGHQFAHALSAWEAILADAELRDLQVRGADGRPVRAADQALLGIAGVRKEARGSLDADVEKRARAVWDGREPLTEEAGERLAREFPHAALTRAALRELAQVHERARQPGRAAHAWRRLLAAGVEGEEQAIALAGLARAYEQEQCWNAARAAWERLGREHGTRTLAALDAARPVREAVADRLRAPPFAAKPTASPSPHLPLFVRSWQIDLAVDEYALPWPDPGARPELLLSARFDGTSTRARLIGRGMASGAIAWTSRLPFAPAWVSAQADLVLAGGPGGAACVRREDGGLVWSFTPPEEWPSSGELEGFRLVGGRLFFLHGGRRLLALDAESGRVLWQQWPPGAEFALPYPEGRFFPHYHAGAETVLLQSAGKRWLLDAGSGKVLHQSSAPREPWPRPVLPLDSRSVCIVQDVRHVVQIDSLTGRELWSWTVPGSSTLSGEPPQLHGDARLLLVVIPTNIGYLLQRVKPGTDGGAWSSPPLLTVRHVDVETWASDSSTVYTVEEGLLCARSLADGERLWERPLTGGEAWQARRVGGLVMAHPLPGSPVRYSFDWPFGSVEWQRGSSWPAGTSFPVVCCDPRTGQPIQCLNFRVEPRWHVSLRMCQKQGKRGLCPTVCTSCLLTHESGPLVRLSPRGGLVALAGRAWALTVSESE
jgi:outer membrane protein assembly factor BamB